MHFCRPITSMEVYVPNTYASLTKVWDWNISEIDFALKKECG